MKSIRLRLFAFLIALLIFLTGAMPIDDQSANTVVQPLESEASAEFNGDEKEAGNDSALNEDALADDMLQNEQTTPYEDAQLSEGQGHEVENQQDFEKETVEVSNDSETASGEPYYEITPAPDLEYGTISGLKLTKRAGVLQPSAAAVTRKISSLNVNDNVMIPLADGRTLKFRVMTKDHYKFGAGVVLMSTQYVTMVTYKCGDTARGAGKYTLAGGGSYYDSILRNYLNTTFYNTLHPNLKAYMKRASQGEQYLMATYQTGVMWRYEYHWYDDYVFMPSTTEVNHNINASHNYFGQSWGANTNWQISNSNVFFIRDRMAADYTMHNDLNKSPTNNFYHIYYVTASGTTSFNMLGATHWANSMVSEEAVPSILLNNDTLIFDGANGPEILVNSPPSAPGTISGPTSLNAWQASSIDYTWGASVDPDGDDITYIVERSINGGAFTQVSATPNRSYSHSIGGSDNNVRIRVKARDSYGNESEYTASNYTYITHNSPPTVPTDLKPSATLINSWETQAIEYTWSASSDVNNDPITYIIESNINNAGWTQVGTTFGLSFSHVVSSTHDSVQVRVQATDGKEPSAYATSALTTIIHDTTQPTISITAAPDSSTGWTSADIIITVVVANALSPLDRLEVPDGISPTGTISLSGKTAIQTFKADTVGDYSFAVYNKAGLSASDTISVGNVDQESPAIAYTTSVPDGEYTNDDVDIFLTLSDTLSGLQRFVTPIGAVELSGSTATYTYTATQNGAPVFTLLDNVFNSSSVNVIINMIDRIKPTARIDAVIKHWHNNDSTSLSIIADDDYSGVANIKMPDGTTHIGDSTTYTITQNGIYTVTATDKAGNVSSEVSYNYAWFDRTSPTIVSLKFEETQLPIIPNLFRKSIVTNKQIQMVISYDDSPVGNDAESGVEFVVYRVYDNTGNPLDEWITTRADSTIPTISYEVNGYVEVQVVDRAGNYSTLERYEILLDSTPPTGTYTMSETSVTSQPVIATLRGEDEQGGSGFKGFILPDGNVLIPQDEIQYTFYDNGTRTFIACDNAGNQTPVVVTVSNIKNALPVVEDILIEKTGAGLLRSLFGFVSNEQIKVSIVAKDAGPLTIYYCITPDKEIPNDAVWLEATDGVVYFETEMMGVFHAKALDIASSWSNTMSREIILDSTLPVINGIEIENGRENLIDIEKLVLGIKEKVSEGVSFSVDATDNFGIDSIEYCVTETAYIPAGTQWFKATDGVFHLQPNLRGYLHVKATDLAGNKSGTIVKELLLDGVSPAVDDILFEKSGSGFFERLATMFGIVSNEQIKAAIIASDHFGIDKILYCVTAAVEESENADWREASDGILYFDTEVNGILHAKAVDYAGNESAVVSRSIILDTTSPVLTLVFEERDNDFEPVVIKVLAEDDSTVVGISGIAGITLPTGEYFAKDYIEHTVKENGEYVFKAADSAGNETVELVEIDYIRPVLLEDWENNAPVIDAVLHAVGKHNIGNVVYDDILSLRYLDLSAKGLVTLPDILGYGKNITRLDLRGNEMVRIPECVLRLENLEYLDLSNNELQSVDNTRIAELKSLNYFDVSLNCLIDYECPAIINNYRNIGNFTYDNQPEQFSFEAAALNYNKEYIGNTIQLNIEWNYDGEPLVNSFEQSRKSLYEKYYGDYKTYRALVYDYRVSSGEIIKHTPDYARIFLSELGILKMSLTVGKSSDFSAFSMRTASNTAITSAAESLEVLNLPTPSIQSIDVARGVVVVDVGNLDDVIKADLKVEVEVYDEQENYLTTTETKIPDSKVCEVPLALIFKKGYIITAKVVNNNFIGEYTQDISQQNGGVSSSGSGNGGSEGRTEYIIVEKIVGKETVLEVEKKGESSYGENKHGTEIQSDAVPSGSGDASNGSESKNLNNAEDSKMTGSEKDSNMSYDNTASSEQADDNGRETDQSGDKEKLGERMLRALAGFVSNKFIFYPFMLLIIIVALFVVAAIRKRKKE